MNSEWVIWLFEGIAVGSALMILFAKSVFHSALHLLVTVISLGVIYGLYGSEFLFLAQIMIYGGGILVLILFATMVTRGKGFSTEVTGQQSLPPLLAAAGIITIATTYIIYAQPNGIPLVIPTKQLGNSLLIDYALPLEVSGILLLASLIGAVIVSVQKPSDV